jgi:hypothetical protein
MNVLDSEVLPHFPGFIRNKRLIFEREPAFLLRGFYFDASAFNKSALVTVFVQPLYIPAKTLHLTLGRRLGRWKPTAESLVSILKAMHDEGTAFLSAVRTPSSLRDSRLFREDSVLTAEAVAYGLYLDGRESEGLRCLSNVESQLRGLSPSIATKALGERASRFRAAHLDGDAVRLLEEWREQTLSAIGLNGNKAREGRSRRPA